MGNCCKKGTDENAEDDTTFYDGDGYEYQWDDGNRKGFTRNDDERHFTQDEIRWNIFWDDKDSRTVLDISGIVDEATMLGSREQPEKIPEGDEPTPEEPCKGGDANEPAEVDGTTTLNNALATNETGYGKVVQDNKGGESQVGEQWQEEPDGEPDEEQRNQMPIKPKKPPKRGKTVRQRPVTKRPKRPTKGASKRSQKTVRGKSISPTSRTPRRTKKIAKSKRTKQAKFLKRPAKRTNNGKIRKKRENKKKSKTTVTTSKFIQV